MQAQLQQLIGDSSLESERLHAQHATEIESIALEFQSQLKRMLPALAVHAINSEPTPQPTSDL